MNWPIRIGSIVLAIVVCFGIQYLATTMLKSDGQRLVALAGLYVTLAVSLNMINGITGQFSIGHAAFYCVGAYIAGFVSLRFFQAQPLQPVLWLVVMMVLGAAAACVAGFVVGLPSLRLRGDYLAIVTLGFGEIIRIVIQNTKELGGAYALDKIPAIREIWLVWLLAIVTIAVSRNLLKTARGLAFLAVREDEVASSAMGVNVTQIKVTAFVLGSAFAGAAGALLAHYETSILPTTFSMDVSFIILTMVVLGGSGSITGSALAAVSLFYLPEYLRSQPPVSGASLAAAVIVIVAVVAVLRRLQHHYHGTVAKKVGLYIGSIVGGVVAKLILGALFGLIPAFAKASYTGDKLRMVIFAGTLIIVMLLRPQGIFAHHEFSWTLIRRLYDKVRGKGAQGAPA